VAPFYPAARRDGGHAPLFPLAGQGRLTLRVPECRWTGVWRGITLQGMARQRRRTSWVVTVHFTKEQGELSASRSMSKRRSRCSSNGDSACAVRHAEDASPLPLLLARAALFG
jgi:hypothetical protein